MEKSRPAQRRPRIEELEPRILYSADVSPLAAAPLIAEQRSIDSAGEFVSRSSVETSAPVAAHASHELVFLDSDVPSYAQLIDDIRTQATDQRKIEVFLLDGNTNGIKQISAVLASQTDINAIHLISHGADGQLKLGATTLNFDSLLGNAAKIKAWGPSLGEGADLLVYGCNVAQHPDGKALIDALSRLTGANVAASDDLTGSVTLGGDWTLEYETGEINTPLAVPDEDQARWAYTLAGPLPNSAPDGADSTVSTVEDNPYTFASADFGFTDTSDTPPNALSGVRIATLPTAGELTLAGVAVSVGQTVSAAEIDSGKLQYAAPTNANGAAYANFSFQVQDDGGTANGGTDVDPLPNKITIDVTPVNDEPVLSGANNFGSINEDATSNPGTLVSALIAGHVTDVDPAAVAGIAVTCVDNSNGAWQYSINGGSTWNNFNAPTESIARLLSADPNNYVRFVPTANWNGTVNNGLTFRAWDGASGTSGETDDTGFRSVMDSFAAVSYGNNNGTNNWITAWAENDGNGGGASSGSIKVSGENMFFKADNAGDGIYREADLSGASSATLSFSYNNHLNDTGIIALQVSNDGGGNYTTLTTFTKSGNSGAGYKSVDISSYVGSNTRVRFFAVASDNGGPLNLDNVQISYKIGIGTAYSSATASSSITVNPANDAPAGSNTTITTLEDSVYTFASTDFGFSDPNDSPMNNLAAVKIIAAPNAGSLSLSGVLVTSGQTILVASLNASALKFTPMSNVSGLSYAAFTFQAQDNGGTANGGVDLDATPNTITIDVMPVSDAPAGVTIDVGVVASATTALAAQSADSPVEIVSPVNLLPRSTEAASEFPKQADIPDLPGAADIASQSPGWTLTVPARSMPLRQAEDALAGSQGVARSDSDPRAASRIIVADSSSRLSHGARPTWSAAKIPGQIVPALTQPVIEPDADSGLMTLTSTDPEFGLAQARLSGQRVSDSWFGDLNRMREKMDAPLAGHQRLMVSSMLITGGMSVGYVVWLFRGGLLLGSLLSSLPAWHVIDPLPVLARSRTRSDEDAAADLDLFEKLLNGAKTAVTATGEAIAQNVAGGAIRIHQVVAAMDGPGQVVAAPTGARA